LCRGFFVLSLPASLWSASEGANMSMKRLTVDRHIFGEKPMRERLGWGFDSSRWVHCAGGFLCLLPGAVLHSQECREGSNPSPVPINLTGESERSLTSYPTVQGRHEQTALCYGSRGGRQSGNHLGAGSP
jgi:hypothetical protein